MPNVSRLIPPDSKEMQLCMGLSQLVSTGQSCERPSVEGVEVLVGLEVAVGRSVLEAGVC